MRIHVHTRGQKTSASMRSSEGRDWLVLFVGDDEVTLFPGALSVDQLQRIADIVNEAAKPVVLLRKEEAA